MPELLVTYAQLESFSSRFRGIGFTTEQTILALEATLAPVLEEWEGSARDKFVEIFRNWLRRIIAHGGLYQGIANSLDQIGVAYKSADRQDLIRIDDIDLGIAQNGAVFSESGPTTGFVHVASNFSTESKLPPLTQPEYNTEISVTEGLQLRGHTQGGIQILGGVYHSTSDPAQAAAAGTEAGAAVTGMHGPVHPVLASDQLHIGDVSFKVSDTATDVLRSLPDTGQPPSTSVLPEQKENLGGG